MSKIKISPNSFHYEVYAQGSVEPDFTFESAEEVLKKWMELDNPSVIYLTAGKVIEGCVDDKGKMYPDFEFIPLLK